MIKVDESKSVTVIISGSSYAINDDNSYRDLLIVLTNPDPAFDFNPDDFSIDPSITDPDLKAVAERYSEFFEDYAKRRKAKLQEKSDEIADGMAVCNSIAADEEGAITAEEACDSADANSETTG